MNPIYLDHNATTPLDERVRTEINRCFMEEIGNAGSPHGIGLRAKQTVHAARDRIARIVAARRHEVIFTSGATESNNLALLGLAQHGRRIGKLHIVSTKIEHKSIVEPLEVLAARGFEIALVPPKPDGTVTAEDVLAAVRDDTLLVTVMHVNNETGVRLPIGDIAEGLSDRREIFLHVDAAQGYGKVLEGLDHPRLDLISISSHKINGPAGVGALIARKRGSESVPLTPLMFGGGQELGLRPGTLPVALISGFGFAAELAANESAERLGYCRELREIAYQRLQPLSPTYHGDTENTLPHVICVSFPDWDADAIIESVDGIAAVSTGSACTSICASASHVLSAMKVPEDQLNGAVRISWSHMTPRQAFDESLQSMVTKLSSER